MRIFTIVYTIFALGLIVSPYSGYAAPSTTLKQQFDKAFEAVLADPSNIDATMHYATLAIEMKDYEAAIPAYERVLIFNPELHDIRLGLGVLYNLLESKDMAKVYFQEVIDNEAAPAEIRKTAENYMTKIE